MSKLLLTGCNGFVGSNFRYYLEWQQPYSKIIGLARPTYADQDIEPNKYTYYGDLCNEELLLHALRGVDVVYHFAAESHVDRSYKDPYKFADSNAKGTLTLLEAARKQQVLQIILFSTDEIYGDESEEFDEDSQFNPTNPYAASKAAAEMFANAYKKSYGMDIRIIRSNNIFGPRQNKEKLIPRTITSCLLGERIPIHGTGQSKRKYIYVEDVCLAVERIAKLGERQGVYNLGGQYESKNIDVVMKIIQKMGVSEDLIDFVEDRPHNDRHYNICCDRLKQLGWREEIGFELGLEDTIEWFTRTLK